MEPCMSRAEGNKYLLRRRLDPPIIHRFGPLPHSRGEPSKPFCQSRHRIFLKVVYPRQRCGFICAIPSPYTRRIGGSRLAAEPGILSSLRRRQVGRAIRILSTHSRKESFIQLSLLRCRGSCSHWRSRSCWGRVCSFEGLWEPHKLPPLNPTCQALLPFLTHIATVPLL